MILTDILRILFLELWYYSIGSELVLFKDRLFIFEESLETKFGWYYI